jgi:hypothetical protein
MVTRRIVDVLSSGPARVHHFGSGLRYDERDCQVRLICGHERLVTGQVRVLETLACHVCAKTLLLDKAPTP